MSPEAAAVFFCTPHGLNALEQDRLCSQHIIIYQISEYQCKKPNLELQQKMIAAGSAIQEDSISATQKFIDVSSQKNRWKLPQGILKATG